VLYSVRFDMRPSFGVLPNLSRSLTGLYGDASTSTPLIKLAHP
jgi:hypothetical protein